MTLTVNNRPVTIAAGQEEQAICAAFKKSRLHLPSVVVTAAAARILRGESVTLGGVTVSLVNHAQTESLPNASAPCTVINGYRVTYVHADKYHIVTPNGRDMPSVTAEGVWEITSREESVTRDPRYENILRATRESVAVLAEVNIIERAFTMGKYVSQASYAFSRIPAITLASAHTQYDHAKNILSPDDLDKLWADARAKFTGWRYTVLKEA